jgi:hypothetical protein
MKKATSELVREILECKPDAVTFVNALGWAGIRLKSECMPVYRTMIYVDGVLHRQGEWSAGHPTPEMTESAKSMDIDASIFTGRNHLTVFERSFRLPDGTILEDELADCP